MEHIISFSQAKSKIEIIAMDTRTIDTNPILFFHLRETIRYKSGLMQHEDIKQNTYFVNKAIPNAST